MQPFRTSDLQGGEHVSSPKVRPWVGFGLATASNAAVAVLLGPTPSLKSRFRIFPCPSLLVAKMTS
jgi:hypothetical protein